MNCRDGYGLPAVPATSDEALLHAGLIVDANSSRDWLIGTKGTCDEVVDTRAAEGGLLLALAYSLTVVLTTKAKIVRRVALFASVASVTLLGFVGLSNGPTLVLIGVAIGFLAVLSAWASVANSVQLASAERSSE